MRRWGGGRRRDDPPLARAARAFVVWLSSSRPARLELEVDDERLEQLARRLEQDALERRAAGQWGAHPGAAARRGRRH